METASKDKLQEFQDIISKMTLEVCCMTVLPELGVRWTEVTRAVRNARLPMTSASVAKILRRYVGKELQADHIDEIVAQLRIKLVASSGGRVWHAIKLLEPVSDPEPVTSWTRLLPSRVLHAARRTVKSHNTHVEVHSAKVGDFLFLSLQQVASNIRRGTPLFVAAPPSEPVAFVTTLSSGALLQAVVQGLGYKKYQDANLYGKDLMSLLRIIDRTWNVNVNQLTELPPYDPQPLITKTGIDYTNTKYNETYVDTIIGPDPPQLNNLEIKSEKPYFDSSRHKKNMAVSMTLKCDNVARTLKTWVAIKAVPPTSQFIKIFHQIKTNKFTYNREDDEE